MGKAIRQVPRRAKAWDSGKDNSVAPPVKGGTQEEGRLLCHPPTAVQVPSWSDRHETSSMGVPHLAVRHWEVGQVVYERWQRWGREQDRPQRLQQRRRIGGRQRRGGRYNWYHRLQRSENFQISPKYINTSIMAQRISHRIPAIRHVSNECWLCQQHSLYMTTSK